MADPDDANDSDDDRPTHVREIPGFGELTVPLPDPPGDDEVLVETVARDINAIAGRRLLQSMNAPRLVPPSMPPPPLPQPVAPPAATRSPQLLLWALVAAAGVALAAGGVVFLRSRARPAEVTPPRATATSAPAAPASAPPPASAPATTPAPSAITAPPAPAEDPPTCFARQFPTGSLTAPAELAFVCSETDPNRGAARVRTELVRQSGGHTSEAMREWSMLGWFDLAAFALIRTRCCAGAEPLRSAQLLSNSCDVDGALARLGQAAVAHDEAAANAAIDACYLALLCAHRGGAGPIFARRGEPTRASAAVLSRTLAR